MDDFTDDELFLEAVDTIVLHVLQRLAMTRARGSRSSSAWSR